MADPRAVSLAASLRLRAHSPECADEIAVAGVIAAWIVTVPDEIEARCTAVELAQERITGGSTVAALLEVAEQYASFPLHGANAPTETTT